MHHFPKNHHPGSERITLPTANATLMMPKKLLQTLQNKGYKSFLFTGLAKNLAVFLDGAVLYHFK